MTIFEAHFGTECIDHDSEAAAVAAVEAEGDGYIVKFVNERSCRMDVYDGVKWRYVPIH